MCIRDRDLDWGPSGVIGDRAFHRDPVAVTELAGALIDGLLDVYKRQAWAMAEDL